MQHTPAQFLGADSQTSALVVVKTQPFASELLAPYAVFFLEVVEGILLPLAQATRERNPATGERDLASGAWLAVITLGITTKSPARPDSRNSLCFQCDRIFGHNGVRHLC
jgi:hypothetical protein